MTPDTPMICLKLYIKACNDCLRDLLRTAQEVTGVSSITISCVGEEGIASIPLNSCDLSPVGNSVRNWFGGDPEPLYLTLECSHLMTNASTG